MGKKNRRSREQITQKRQVRAQVDGYSHVQRLLTGGLPMTQFDPDVQGAIADVDQLDKQLVARGWVFLDEGAIGAISWEWPPSRATNEELYGEDAIAREPVTVLGLYLDDLRDLPRLSQEIVLSAVGGGTRAEDEEAIPRNELMARLPAIEAMRCATQEDTAGS